MQPLHGCLQHTLFTGISNTNMSLAARAECAARNADDLLALEQLLAEFLARQAERADVRESVERALRLGADNAVDPGQPGQQQLSAAAVVISFLGVFPGAWLTARHAAGQKLPAAIVVGVCCLAVCMLARLLFFGNREVQILPGMLAMLVAAALGGIAGSTQRKPARRRRR